MKKFIKNTGLTFTQGQALKTSDLTTINNTLNNVVDVVNKYLSGLYDVNVETENYEPQSLTSAIHKVNRRVQGIKVRFLGFDEVYEEYSYVGSSVDDSDWYNEENWTCGPVEIDGGSW